MTRQSRRRAGMSRRTDEDAARGVQRDGEAYFMIVQAMSTVLFFSWFSTAWFVLNLGNEHYIDTHSDIWCVEFVCMGKVMGAARVVFLEDLDSLPICSSASPLNKGSLATQWANERVNPMHSWRYRGAAVFKGCLAHMPHV
jgi:hypothetical protein